MALITIHIDDSRNMTPKITQALGEKKMRKIERNVKNIFEVANLSRVTERGRILIIKKCLKELKIET